jgi:hypothetical protein
VAYAVNTCLWFEQGLETGKGLEEYNEINSYNPEFCKF